MQTDPDFVEPMRPIAIDQSFIHCVFVRDARVAISLQLPMVTNRTNGANREASLTSRYPLLTVRLVLAFWQFVCLCLLDMCGSVSVKGNKFISLWVSRLKIATGQRTMFGRDYHWSGQSLTTLGTRGFFSRATGSFVSSAAGRHVFGQRPKTRAAKPLTF